MSHISQHIHDAFPDAAEAISRLKTEDAHFQALAAQFEALDDEASLLLRHQLAPRLLFDAPALGVDAGAIERVRGHAHRLVNHH